MPTAIQDKKQAHSSPNQGPEGKGKFLARSFQVYKPGEGTLTRLGFFVILISFVFYSAHSFYYGWGSLRDYFLGIFSVIHCGFLLEWSLQSAAAEWISSIGAVLLFALGAFFIYYFLYAKPKTAEFLIQTDGELRKVTWPKIDPWFKPSTQVWGAAYVVLILVVLMAVFIFGIDFIFSFVSRFLFYPFHQES